MIWALWITACLLEVDLHCGSKLHGCLISSQSFSFSCQIPEFLNSMICICWPDITWRSDPSRPLRMVHFTGRFRPHFRFIGLFFHAWGLADHPIVQSRILAWHHHGSAQSFCSLHHSARCNLSPSCTSNYAMPNIMLVLRLLPKQTRKVGHVSCRFSRVVGARGVWGKWLVSKRHLEHCMTVHNVHCH